MGIIWRIFLAAVLVLFPTMAALAQGPYLAADGGVAVYHDSDTQAETAHENAVAAVNFGYGLDLAGGYRFNDSFRADGELGYRYAHIDGLVLNGKTGISRLSVLGLMVNGYYDFRQIGPVVPYVGLGVGALRGEVKASNGSGASQSYRDTVPGYQAMLGVSFRINERVKLTAGYRFQAAIGDFKGPIFGLDGKTSYHCSNLVIGTRYDF